MKNVVLLAMWGVLVTAALAFQPLPAQAGGTVGNGNPASCTASALRTRLAGGGLVTFNCGPVPVTIIISPTDVISLDTTIEGGGVITLSGNSQTSIFDIQGGRVTLSGLTLRDGFGKGGGAVYNNGQLTVLNSRFVNNHAVAIAGAISSGAALTITHTDFYSNSAGFDGGAIYATVNLAIHDSSFEFNRAEDGGAVLYNTNAGRAGRAGRAGPAAAAAGPRFTLDGSQFYSNTATIGRGGAILNFGTTAITNSDFQLSQSPLGGAVHNALDASLTVENSRFVSNTTDQGVGGALLSLGHLVVNDSTFTGNSALNGGRGGALALDSAGTALVMNSTFSGNSALLGGGLVTSGTMTLSNTTLAGNGAFIGGGVDVLSGTLTVTNSTFTDNSGVFLFGASAIENAGGLVKLKNTLVAGDSSNNCQGSLVSLGHNLDDGHTCGLNAGGDLTNTNPLLGPLAENGGPTLTAALLPGSPAINHGDNNGCPLLDQRGLLRIDGCDVGAFEFYAHRLLLPLIRR